MKLVLITPPNQQENEIKTLEYYHSLGFKIHIRKPNWDDSKLQPYTKNIIRKNITNCSIHGYKNSHYNSNINRLYGLHLRGNESINDTNKLDPNITYSKSVHTLNDCHKQPKYISYIFLSPIFDSISKIGYRSQFSESQLTELLAKKRHFNIDALGGLSLKTLPMAIKLGFDGAVFMGDVWQRKYEDRLVLAKRIKKAIQDN